MYVPGAMRAGEAAKSPGTRIRMVISLWVGMGIKLVFSGSAASALNH